MKSTFQQRNRPKCCINLTNITIYVCIRVAGACIFITQQSLNWIMIIIIIEHSVCMYWHTLLLLLYDVGKSGWWLPISELHALIESLRLSSSSSPLPPPLPSSSFPFHFDVPIYMSGVCGILTLMYILHSIRSADNISDFFTLYTRCNDIIDWISFFFFRIETCRRYHDTRSFAISFLCDCDGSSIFCDRLFLLPMPFRVTNILKYGPWIAFLSQRLHLFSSSKMIFKKKLNKSNG